MRNDLDLINAIRTELQQVTSDVTVRNEYINDRDRSIYNTGLFEGLQFNDGADKTLFNYLPRVVDIHTTQLMGRGFSIYSTYNKEDTSDAEIQEPAQTEQAPGEEQQPNQAEAQQKLQDKKNKLKQVNADERKRYVDAIIRDNGGMKVLKHGARIGSAYGFTVFKLWAEKANKKIRYSLLETPQNYYVGWSDSNFREKDWDAYVYQISESQAYKLYGDKLKEGEMFAVTDEGVPLGDANTADPINTVNSTNNYEDTRTKRKMVSVYEFTGILPRYGVKDGKCVDVPRGQEQPINILVVGNHVVQEVVDPDLMPYYYKIDNQMWPRRAWGKSDVSDEAIDINRTLLETLCTWITLYGREVGPVYKAKGYETATIPKRKTRQATFVPMSLEQDISLLEQPTAYTGESKGLVDTLMDSLVRVTNISRAMFDDPTLSANSNQALMTTMKSLLDTVEDKQSRWDEGLTAMFTKALELTAKIIPETKTVITEDPDWYLYIEWPSVLRREDATYQQMYLNLFNAGVISLETYMEKLGFSDTTEEVDRIRDELKDPTTAAVLGKQIGLLAQQTIAPPQAPAPDVKVSLRGDLTPNQEANIATKQGFQDGPFPATAGPQGQAGLATQENADNKGYVQGNAFAGGTGVQVDQNGNPVPPPQDQPNPQLTVDQNQGQTASQPGSGAPAVSPEGAINQIQQQGGM